MTFFLSVSPLSPSFVTMSSSEPIGVGRVNRWTRKAVDQRSENFHYEVLAFSGHNIDLLFDEENMKPENSPRRWEKQALIQVP